MRKLWVSLTSSLLVSCSLEGTKLHRFSLMKNMRVHYTHAYQRPQYTGCTWKHRWVRFDWRVITHGDLATLVWDSARLSPSLKPCACICVRVWGVASPCNWAVLLPFSPHLKTAAGGWKLCDSALQMLHRSGLILAWKHPQMMHRFTKVITEFMSVYVFTLNLV